MTLLEAEELYRFFHVGDEEVRALRGVGFALDAGEMVALMGPSGSGKSTLLMCLAGLDEPDGGMVRITGVPITRRPEAEKMKLRSRHLGIMRQKDNLFAHLSVAENVALARSLSTANGAMPGLLDRVGLARRMASLPAQLSGGEKARAGLAVAMARRPEILLLDEPTGEVDAESECAILAVLGEYRADGGAIVVATHNAAVAHGASRMLTMRDGKINHG
ncbi:MAG TPA: ATP-binding cassette domain-containing protein [Nordella sp.]|nr:ATP-binding cassette domain-containing protein [Nordella sp.]